MARRGGAVLRGGVAEARWLARAHVREQGGRDAKVVEQGRGDAHGRVVAHVEQLGGRVPLVEADLGRDAHAALLDVADRQGDGALLGVVHVATRCSAARRRYICRTMARRMGAPQ